MRPRLARILSITLASLLALPLTAGAGSTAASVRVAARVDPAPCTAEQRKISKSCAAVEEATWAQPASYAVVAESGVASPRPRYEVVVDPTRQTMVRTLRY